MASKDGLLSVDYGLLRDVVACCFGLLGFPGSPGDPNSPK